MSNEREESAIARSSRILAEKLAEQKWGRGLGIAAERERILLRVASLKRFDDVEEAQGCGVEPSEDGWLVDYEEVIAAIRGEQA